MKKLILLVLIGFIGMLTIPKAEAQNAYVTRAVSLNAWGTAADTLTASVAKTYVIRVKTPQMLKLQGALFTDAVSGTPAYTAILARSMDGVNYVGFDTTTHSGGGDKYDEYTAVDATYGWYRLTITATAGAQKSLLYGYFIFRNQ